MTELRYHDLDCSQYTLLSGFRAWRAGYVDSFSGYRCRGHIKTGKHWDAEDRGHGGAANGGRRYLVPVSPLARRWVRLTTISVCLAVDGKEAQVYWVQGRPFDGSPWRDWLACTSYSEAVSILHDSSHRVWRLFRDVRVAVGDCRLTDHECFDHACVMSDYSGSFDDWQRLSDDDRDEYEYAAGFGR